MNSYRYDAVRDAMATGTTVPAAWHSVPRRARLASRVGQTVGQGPYVQGRMALTCRRTVGKLDIGDKKGGHAAMPRTDIHLDAMLRHLGAAYYESLHGRASRADVTRALDAVEEHLHEPSRPSQAGITPPPGLLEPHARRWTRRVRDVMTTSVVTTDRLTPYKDIVRLLTEHRISGVPVLSMGRHVVGVVTEADLLTEEDKDARARMARPGRLWRRTPKQWALTAGELMTSPAITINPDATIPGAARTMNAHHIRRLPVVDEDGRLLGLVSRRDLLSVFLRPDADIATEVRQIFDEVLHADPAAATVTAKNGVIVITGPLGAERDLVAVAIRLAWGVDGVVDVVDRRSAAYGQAGHLSVIKQRTPPEEEDKHSGGAASA